MRPEKNTKAERSSLKLTLKRRDSFYSVEGISDNSSDSTQNRDVINENYSSKMTEQDTSFNSNGDSMHDTSDELNTPNISPEKEIPKEDPDPKDDLSNSSFIFQENSYKEKSQAELENSDRTSESDSHSDEHPFNDKEEVNESSSTVPDSNDAKPALRSDEPEPPVVVKKEKPENGEVEKDEEPPEKTPDKPTSNIRHLVAPSCVDLPKVGRPNSMAVNPNSSRIINIVKGRNGQLFLVRKRAQTDALKSHQSQMYNKNLSLKANVAKLTASNIRIMEAEHLKRPYSLAEREDAAGEDGSQGGSSSDVPSGGGGGSGQPTDNGSSAAEYDSDAETVAPPEEVKPPPAHPVISVRKAEDLMISRPQVNGDDTTHFPCPDCPGLAFSSSQELGQHQASHHQSSVQQLAQQVQRIPAQFQSPSYRVPTPPQRTQYMSPPPMVPFYQGGMAMPHEGTTQTIGSGVVLSTVTSQAVPNLPPGIQLSKRPAAQPPEGSAPKQRREEIETRRLPDSITLSRTPAAPPSPARNSVTDLLANRGITVVPSGRTNPPQASSATPTLPRSLSSAISITPSSQQQHRQSQNFAVPAPKQLSRLLTVDLTKESDAPPRNRVMQPTRGGRMRGPSTRSVCQICDKAFPTPQELQQHMACHRAGGAPNKLAYECRECTAQYPTEAGLQAHRQKYHGAGGPSPDMAIPVVDLKQVGVLSRLAALGIRSVIPLNQLHSGSGNGIFGLPVVAVDAANNPAICNIGGLGASNLLPLGPLKNLTFNNNLR